MILLNTISEGGDVVIKTFLAGVGCFDKRQMRVLLILSNGIKVMCRLCNN